ncbi:MAG TPA: nucleotidyl transferase AbiEii/AbiGii toxin family protein [Streptosporangiaceae bacterium]
MATPVEQELRRAVADFDALRVRWALIGGLAISVRSVPRFTKDLDFAVAVANDSEAEDVVHRLRGRGYQPVQVLSRST